MHSPNVERNIYDTLNSWNCFLCFFPCLPHFAFSLSGPDIWHLQKSAHCSFTITPTKGFARKCFRGYRSLNWPGYQLVCLGNGPVKIERRENRVKQSITEIIHRAPRVAVIPILIGAFGTVSKNAETCYGRLDLDKCTWHHWKRPVVGKPCYRELKHTRFWDAGGNRKRTFRVRGQWCLPDFYNKHLFRRKVI